MQASGRSVNQVDKNYLFSDFFLVNMKIVLRERHNTLNRLFLYSITFQDVLCICIYVHFLQRGSIAFI